MGVDTKSASSGNEVHYMEHSFYIDPRPVSTGSRYVKVASGAVCKRYEENLLHPKVGSPQLNCLT